MRVKTLATIAAIPALLVGCGSGSSGPRALTPVSIGKAVRSQTRNETVEAYAERVLTQSFKSPLQGAGQAGELAIGDVKVCIPASATTQLVRARDYELVLADGKHIAATAGAVGPAFPNGPVSPGGCVHGVLDWVVAPDSHPTIADERTGAQWKPNCPRSTASGLPCQILPASARA